MRSSPILIRSFDVIFRSSLARMCSAILMNAAGFLITDSIISTTDAELASATHPPH